MTTTIESLYPSFEPVYSTVDFPDEPAGQGLGDAPESKRLALDGSYTVPKWVYGTDSALYVGDPLEIEILNWLDWVDPVRNLAEIAPDDSDLGDLLARALQDWLIWVADANEWYRYSPRRGMWSNEDAGAEVLRFVKEFCKCLRVHVDIVKAAAVNNIEGEPHHDEAIIKVWDKEITRYKSNVRAQQRLIDSAKTGLVHMSYEFDPDPDVLNCCGWLMSLDGKKKARRAKATDMCSRSASVEYAGERDYFTGSRFERFLDEITLGDDDINGFLQRALGYSATARTSYECMFIALGKTARNGKGVLFNSVARVLGSYTRTVSTSLIVSADGRRRDAGESASPMLASIAGARYVTMSEPAKGSTIDDAALKSLTGNDPIYARRLYAQAPTRPMLPTWHLWMSCNSMPRITDAAIYGSDRVWVIPFKRHFGEDERDPLLKDKLCEPNEQRAILQWLIEGARLVASEGLVIPSVIREETRLCLAGIDFDRLLKEMGYKIGGMTLRRDVYRDYERWCDKYDTEPRPRGEFYELATAFGIPAKRLKSGRYLCISRQDISSQDINN